MPPTMPPPAGSLDLIPDPADVHDQVRASARHAKLLRRQLRLSLAAKTEREAPNARPAPPPAGEAVARG